MVDVAVLCANLLAKSILKICSISWAHHVDGELFVFFVRLYIGLGRAGPRLAAGGWESPSENKTSLLRVGLPSVTAVATQ